MREDQLDQVYSDYFRREIPAELPPFMPSEPARVVRSNPRSGYVLAASVAALAGLGLWLSTYATPAKETAKGSATKLLKDAEADGRKLLDHIDRP
jgi:hypothetical protein